MGFAISCLFSLQSILYSKLGNISVKEEGKEAGNGQEEPEAKKGKIGILDIHSAFDIKNINISLSKVR